MRYTAEHKAQTREKLLCEAGAQAKETGFAITGVDAFMKRVGLTGAAFYSHFASKEALFAELVERELNNSLKFLGVTPGPQALSTLQKTLEYYLTCAHADHPEKGCVLPALGAEMARAPLELRQKSEEKLTQLVSNWAPVLGSKELAWAVLSQCLGSLMLARMLATEQSREQVLEASRQMLKQQLKTVEPAPIPLP